MGTMWRRGGGKAVPLRRWVLGLDGHSDRELGTSMEFYEILQKGEMARAV